MSNTYPVWQLTNYPDTLDKANSNLRQGIVDFENRTSSTDPMLYYVLSNDVKALQQAIFAMQETLGIRPQSTFTTVDGRIAALEDYTDLDSRYGGSTWRSIAEAQRPTIMGHLHDGTNTGASKIDLESHTTGTLRKSNINLDRTDPEGLTGEDICLSSTTSQTITGKFAEKLDKTGGTIQGATAYLTVNAPFNCRVYKEADAYQCISSSSPTGDSVSDSEAFSGTARRVSSSHPAGEMMSYTSQLRYGYYSLGLRAKVSNNSPMQAIGKVSIYAGSTLLKEVPITPSDFESTDYQMFYVAFSHKGNPNFKVVVSWYGTSIQPPIPSDFYVDSLVITPVHVTTYDLDD